MGPLPSWENRWGDVIAFGCFRCQGLVYCLHQHQPNKCHTFLPRQLTCFRSVYELNGSLNQTRRMKCTWAWCCFAAHARYQYQLNHYPVMFSHWRASWKCGYDAVVSFKALDSAVWMHHYCRSTVIMYIYSSMLLENLRTLVTRYFGDNTMQKKHRLIPRISNI